VIGLFISFIGIDPINALVYTAVINGIVAVPMLYVEQSLKIGLTINIKFLYQYEQKLEK
jgi:ABC-type transporter Mla maintaining outer membrane lipid asymmetry permease subunit MlaE